MGQEDPAPPHVCGTEHFSWYCLYPRCPILISVDLHRNGTEPHILAWFSGGMFVLMAIPLALYEIFMHLVWYIKPESQRYIIRIIWMVPVYAVESGLRCDIKIMRMQAAREFYEAFVILSFLQYTQPFGLK